MVPASAIAKWTKLGITGAAAAAAMIALTPHVAGAATGGATLAGPEAQAQAAPEGADADKLAAGRELFNNWSCGTCHALKDAEGSGHVGPSLDGNPNLTEAFIVERVTNGAGPMPGFGGQMSDEEIAELAAYIHQVALK
ncbi:MAG TPA: cytochrome c [Sphingobium sp.]|nr:cytochrome c [Sphingobium sp.]